MLVVAVRVMKVFSSLRPRPPSLRVSSSSARVSDSRLLIFCRFMITVVSGLNGAPVTFYLGRSVPFAKLRPMARGLVLISRASPFGVRGLAPPPLGPRHILRRPLIASMVTPWDFPVMIMPPIVMMVRNTAISFPTEELDQLSPGDGCLVEFWAAASVLAAPTASFPCISWRRRRLPPGLFLPISVFFVPAGRHLYVTASKPIMFVTIGIIPSVIMCMRASCKPKSP